MQNVDRRIGDKLRKLRLESDFKQEYLADELSVSQKTYSNMENGRSPFSIEILERICEIYRIELVDLLTGTPVPKFTDVAITMSTLSEELLVQLKARVDDLKELLTEKNKRIEILEKSKAAIQ